MDPSRQTTWQMYRSLALSVYVPSFLMSICQGSVLLVITLFALDLGATPAMAALVFAMRGLGNMVNDVPAGYSAGRLGDKATMVIGVSVMAVTGLLASFCKTPGQLAVAAFFFGGAMATWMIARLTHISEAVHISQRGKAISTMAGLQRFGNLLGPIATGIIADQFGFRYVFLMICGVATLALVIVAVAVPQNRRGHAEDGPGILLLVPTIVSRHRRVFATAGVAVLLLTVLRAARQLLIPLWGESIGLESTDIGLVVGLAAALDMTMFPIAGYLMDNWGRKYAALGCMSLLSVGLVTVPLADSFMTLLGAAAVVAIGNGLGSGINMTLGADFAPPADRGSFLGVWRLMGDVGSFCGPILMGHVASSYLLATAFSLTFALGASGVVIMAFLVQETLTTADRGPER